jgi:RsmE family RNA methyltransferase
VNLLLCEQDEIKDDRVVLSGRRAGHILQILKLGLGDTLRGGIINGNIGTAEVLETGDDMVVLQTCFDRPPQPPPPIRLILALPRPIMLQRILKQAATLGFKSVDLIRTSKVVKSYFQSPVLQPEKIRASLVDGLEQAMDTRLPDVRVYDRFKPYIEDELPKSPAYIRLLAHPTATNSLIECMEEAHRQVQKNVDLLLAIGPEGGWTDYEVQRMQEAGFRSFSMGSRILHVDTAVVALLAQVELARQFVFRATA